MKTKTTLISLVIIVLIIGIIFFVRTETVLKTTSPEVAAFLTKFDNNISQGNTDTLMACFQADRNDKPLIHFVNLLTGKKEEDGTIPPAAIKLHVNHAVIKNINDRSALVTIPATFSRDSLAVMQSKLVLKIIKTADNQYKIIQVDTKHFYRNYKVYIKELNLPH
jgi:hypothetical protein